MSFQPPLTDMQGMIIHDNRVREISARVGPQIAETIELLLVEFDESRSSSEKLPYLRVRIGDRDMTGEFKKFDVVPHVDGKVRDIRLEIPGDLPEETPVVGNLLRNIFQIDGLSDRLISSLELVLNPEGAESCGVEMRGYEGSGADKKILGTIRGDLGLRAWSWCAGRMLGHDLTKQIIPPQAEKFSVPNTEISSLFTLVATRQLPIAA